MKKSLAALFILVFCLPFLQLNASTANPYIETPAITITQPSPSFLTCYPNTSIPIEIGVRVLETETPNNYIPQIENISYGIDDNQNVTLTNLTEGAKFYADLNTIGVTLMVSSTIDSLPEGNHVLKAYSLDSNGEMLTTQTTFTVDSTYASPKLNIISPQNKTYSNNDIPLIFSINKEYQDAKYLIDDDFSSGNYTLITGNTTLVNLTDGSHTICVSAVAKDKYHLGTPVGQFITFNIDGAGTVPESTQKLETGIIVVGIFVPLLLGSIYLFYYRRKKNCK
ncbi:MAG: hypothetical protein ACFCUE_13095 [Candidatus Bathyarchaeia archaeon]|jgi:hypothetical protein